MPMVKKRRKSLLKRVQNLKAKASGSAWEALHRAETTIARNEGKIRRKGAGGRPKKSKKVAKKA